MPDYSGAACARRRDAFRKGLFEWAAGTRSKVRCTRCTGQSTSSYGYLGGSWMDKHLGDHAACPDCGKVRPVVMMKAHRNGRWHKRGRVSVDSTGC